jgi:hypothetical protein
MRVSLPIFRLPEAAISSQAARMVKTMFVPVSPSARGIRSNVVTACWFVPQPGEAGSDQRSKYRPSMVFLYQSSCSEVVSSTFSGSILKAPGMLTVIELTVVNPCC